MIAKHRQYQIDRWRLDEEQYRAPVLSDCPSNSDNRRHAVRRPLDLSLNTTWFPLPADHLLHLIKYNAFRALAQNKAMLERLALQYRTADLQIKADPAIFPSYSVILPVAPHLSGCLTPTTSQMNIVHSTWINFLPFPAMRDNLIKREFEFNHSDFIKDLVGEQINLQIFWSTPMFSMSTGSKEDTVTQGGLDDDNDTTDTATGLIVWGEPYRTDSWEATRGSLKKWGWAVGDCQELVNSTNYWRGSRGERPLSIESGPSAADDFVTP